MEKLKRIFATNRFYKIRLFIEKVFDNTVGLFMFQYQRRDNLFNWFYNTLKDQHIAKYNYTPKYTYYEFGVAGGGSMKIYILALQRFCKDFKLDINKFYIYGFDSFSGLPEAQDGDKKGDWNQGGMKHARSEVEKVIKGLGFPMKNVRLIEGFFDQSLTQNLALELKSNPPAIVNMDADYYSSTKTVFDWVLDFTPSGTMFRFDDIWAFYGHRDRGVIKAIEEVNTKGDKGWLTSYPSLGLAGYVYTFARKEFEY